MSNVFKLFTLLLLVSMLISCSIKQDLNINLDGSGIMELSAVLDPVFVSYLFDIAEATTDIKSLKELVIFNTTELKTALEKEPGIIVEQIRTKTQGSLEIKVRYKDLVPLSASLSPQSKQKLIVFKDTNGTKEFQFYLDKSNYKDIKKLFPVLSGPIFENLEPQENESVSREEYLDIIEFAMEKAGRKAVLASYIDINLKVQGKILSRKGGTLKDNVINYKIPLLDVLLLNTPIEFSVKYK